MGDANQTKPSEVMANEITLSRNLAWQKTSIAAVICMVLLVAFRSGLTYPLDDAYITLHNAAVLRNGVDPNYSGVSPLAGATSPIHLAAITVLSFVVPAEWAPLLLCVTFALLYPIGVLLAAQHMGASRRAAGLVMLVAMLSAFTIYHLFNGLETGMSMAAVSWATFFATRKKLNHATPILFGIMPFIRPELSILSAAFMAQQLFVRYERTDLAGAATDVLIFVAAALPWAAWSYLNTGSIALNTAEAKAMYFAEAQLPISAKLTLLRSTISPIALLPAVMGLCFVPRNRVGICLTGFMITLIVVYSWKLPGWMNHNYGRYLQILIPPSLILLAAISDRERIANWILVALLVLGAFAFPRAYGVLTENWRHTHTSLATAKWASETLPANATVLIHDAGYVSYETKLRLIDLVGLKTPSSIAVHRTLTYPTNGALRGPATCKIASANRATHAIILKDHEAFWSQIAVDLRNCRWRLTTLKSAQGFGDYSVFRLDPPNGRSD